MVDTIVCKDEKEVLDAIQKKRNFSLHPTLTTLYLWNNNIGSEGAKFISDSLKSNTTLTTLHLDSNNIGSEGAKFISESLKSNTTLTLLDLGGNNIGSEGIKFLSDSLKSNTTLTSLILAGNNIDDNGAQLLLSMLKVNYSLNNILSNINIQENFIRVENKCSSSIISEIEKELVNNSDPSKVSEKKKNHPKTPKEYVILVEFESKNLKVQTKASTLSELKKAISSKIKVERDFDLMAYDDTFKKYIHVTELCDISSPATLTVKLADSLATLSQIQNHNVKLFQPQYSRALIVINSDYEKDDLSPLPGAMLDSFEISKFVQSEMKIPKSNVQKLTDRTASEIQKALDNLITAVETISLTNQKGLIFVYFSGHGFMRHSHTFGFDKMGNTFELTNAVKKLKVFKNHFTVALFDCCRVHHTEVEKGNTPPPPLIIVPEPNSEISRGQAVTIFGAKGGEKALTYDDKMSLMTSEFLKFIRGTGIPFPMCLTNWEFLSTRGEQVCWSHMQIELLPGKKN